MATLTPESFDVDGLDATYNAADAGGDEVANDGKVLLHVKNGDASSHTVTTTAQNATRTFAGYGDASFSNSAVAIPAGEERFIGPFPEKTFNDSSGNIQITYDDVTSVTIAVLQLD